MLLGEAVPLGVGCSRPEPLPEPLGDAAARGGAVPTAIAPIAGVGLHEDVALAVAEVKPVGKGGDRR